MIIQQLLWIYCRVRFAQYVLQFLSNALLPDHDAKVFNPPFWTDEENTVIHRFFSGLRRWDAVHFLHIARYGYTYENLLAFFPGYPIVFIRPFAWIFSSIFNDADAFLFAGVFLNFLLGFANCCLIYHLALKYRLTPSHAYWSSILFMINPATIFFLAPYSESLFLFCQLLGHFSLQSNQLFFSTLCFACGSSVRSNGIVSVGFLLYYSLQKIYQTRRFVVPVHYFLLSLTPFVLVQYFHYRTFCFQRELSPSIIDYGNEQNLKMPLTNFSSSWCEKSLPFSYQYVQRVYWNVGFFKYWQWKQIPNFLLASPMFYLIGRTVREYSHQLKVEWRRRKSLFQFFFGKSPRQTSSSSNSLFTNEEFLPHLFYSLFLSFFALISMHIQVVTRFLFSSGPFLYYICAHSISESPSRSLLKNFSLLKRHSFVFFYCFIYVLFGICLFSNFLPWT